MKNSYDVVIIGAGPAGASAARAAAQRGAKVLMIDRRRRIGIPVQCAEFVTQWVSRYAHFSSKSILQKIETMITHLPDGTSYEMKGPGYLLDRSLFDKELVASAVLAGAKISIETRAEGLSAEGLAIERGSEKEIIQSKIFIGADGVHSSIGRLVGRPNLKTIVGLQYEVILPEPQSHVDIFFHKDYEGGYAWFFPKGKTANVGVGVIPEKTNLLLGLLDHFLDHLVDLRKLSSVEIIAKTGGSIPCGKPGQTVFGNTLLVGDAAGHAHPITGGGILNAVVGGEIAGRIAAEAVDRGDLRYLENYEMEWRETFGKSLSYGALKREFLEENWNKPGVGFEGLIRKTWVGFKEYYEDRKNWEIGNEKWEVVSVNRAERKSHGTKS
jgi:digeranylgeranylglycerophospholipid reductase